MEKISYEKLKTVKGLTLPGTITSSSEAELIHELDVFTENLPQKTYEMIKLMVAEDYSQLQIKLDEMTAVLNKIYAVDTGRKCYKLARTVKGDIIKVEVDIQLEKIVSELNTLSIDIQTLQYKKGDDEGAFAQAKSSSQNQKNILAVDDDPVILNVLKKAIDSEKYKFSGAVSGKTALKYLETHTPPDLIILDIEMPEMNGYELAGKIISKKHGIPVIFLTSNATKEHIMKAMQIGAIDFLVKPVNEELILNKLDKYAG